VEIGRIEFEVAPGKNTRPYEEGRIIKAKKKKKCLESGSSVQVVLTCW
jgi:hypothetical protein